MTEDTKPGEDRLRLPKLYPKQHYAIMAPERYAVIEASTKSGKTVACIIWIVTQAWGSGKDGRNYWWIAPIRSQAKIAYRRLVRLLRKADPHKEIWQCHETELWIEFANGARIWFKGSDDPDSLFGEDVYGCVIDEATRCKEEAWFAVRTTLTATEGHARIIGNVKGKKNWAYRLARKAEAGEPNHSYAKLTAHDAVDGGVLTAGEIEDAEATLPGHVFKELYLAEAADDEGNPFGGSEVIAKCARDDLAKGPVAYWGFDLAKSHDWTVGIGFNAKGDTCVYQRWQSDWRNTTKRIIAMIGNKPALIDSTGVGDPIVEEVQARCSQVEGYLFTSRSKQQLMEGLASSIHQERITYPKGAITNELDSFEYEYRANGVRYSAPEGMFDDCVCSLALVNRLFQIAPRPPEFSVVGSSDGQVYNGELHEILTGYEGWTTF